MPKTATTPPPTVKKKAPTPTPQPVQPPETKAFVNDELLNQALSFKAQYEALLDQAKANALTQIQTLLDKLQTMGHAYQLVPLTSHSPKPTKLGATGKRDWRRPPKAYDPTKRCPYCNITGHDARAHRGQAPNPRAFTTEELRAQNYLPPTASASDVQ